MIFNLAAILEQRRVIELYSDREIDRDEQELRADILAVLMSLAEDEREMLEADIDEVEIELKYIELEQPGVNSREPGLEEDLKARLAMLKAKLKAMTP